MVGLAIDSRSFPDKHPNGQCHLDKQDREWVPDFDYGIVRSACLAKFLRRELVSDFLDDAGVGSLATAFIYPLKDLRDGYGRCARQSSGGKTPPGL